mgnify:FL=1
MTETKEKKPPISFWVLHSLIPWITAYNPDLATLLKGRQDPIDVAFRISTALNMKHPDDYETEAHWAQIAIKKMQHLFLKGDK